MDETQQEELWRLRAIEVDRDQWRAIAREGASALEHHKKVAEERGKVTIEQNRRLVAALTEVTKQKDRVMELEDRIRSLESQIKLQDEYNFQVMEFRIATRHWTVDENHSIFKAGDLVPVVLEYK